ERAEALRKVGVDDQTVLLVPEDEIRFDRGGVFGERRTGGRAPQTKGGLAGAPRGQQRILERHVGPPSWPPVRRPIPKRSDPAGIDPAGIGRWDTESNRSWPGRPGSGR